MRSIQHLIGTKFGRLTLLEDLGRKNLKRWCVAICDCGTIDKYNVNSLKTGHTQSCGCLEKSGDNKRKNIEHLIGQKYSRLTIKEDAGNPKQTRMCVVECDCGIIKTVKLADILNGTIQSCGCLAAELSSFRATTHGLTKHPLYTVWVGIKNRCISRQNYGDIGVRVCDEWLNNFVSFYEWALANGWKPGLQIDKDKLSPTKPGKLYSPEFCCFLTRTENNWFKSTSRIVEYNGISKCLSEWCNDLNLDYSLVNQRINNGWSVKEAFETSKTGFKSIKFNNQTKTLFGWCKKLNLNYATIYSRVKDFGWPYEEALSIPIKKYKTQ